MPNDKMSVILIMYSTVLIYYYLCNFFIRRFFKNLYKTFLEIMSVKKCLVLIWLGMWGDDLNSQNREPNLKLNTSLE